jgi:hypothetical protein
MSNRCTVCETRQRTHRVVNSNPICPYWEVMGKDPRGETVEHAILRPLEFCEACAVEVAFMRNNKNRLHNTNAVPPRGTALEKGRKAHA